MNPAAVAAAAARHSGPPQPGQPLKFTVAESCDRIKEEFNFLQAQYHNLKLECEKLASEKIEIQRHYVMYYEMSYGLNVEMHKQTEIVKRLNTIIGQVLPFLSQEHQQQVAAAVERAKQVTVSELNAIIGMQHAAGQLPHSAAHGPPIPIMPHPGLPGAPGLPPSSAAGLLALSGSLGGPMPHPLGLLGGKNDIHRDSDSKGSSNAALGIHEERHRRSLSPLDREKYRTSSRTPPEAEVKKIKKEDKSAQGSDGEKSDQDLVVDDPEDMPTSNGQISPRENGLDKMGIKKEVNIVPHSPRSGTSSNASTPSTKKLDVDKPSTPVSKSVTPTSSGTPGSGKPNISKPPSLLQYPPYIGAAPQGMGSDVSSANAAFGALHNSMNYPRSLVGSGYEHHPQARGPGLTPAAMSNIAGGKPNGIITSALLNFSRTPGHSLLAGRPVHSPFGTWPLPHPESRQSSPLAPLHVTL